MATLDITNPEELAQFNEALNTAPASRLRDIIRDVCRDPPAALLIISNSLLVPEDQVPEQPEPDSDSSSGSKCRFGFGSEAPRSSVEIYAAAAAAAAAPAPAPARPDDGILDVKPARLALESKKMVRLRYAVCRKCGEEYDISKNSGESCFFHSGSAEENLDHWADEDRWDYDELTATEEDRLKHAKGWIYSCCGRYYGERGCKGRWHEEETDDLKRRRVARMA